MKLLSKLERSIGPYALPNLSLYLIAGQVILFVVARANPGLVAEMMLIPDLVLQGQVWRLLTFVFFPASGNVLFLFIELYLLWMMGSALEQQWGTFRYNLYLAIGFGLTVAAAFVHPGLPTSNYVVLSTVFLAFAFLYPNYELLLFFVLPVKVKWLGALTGAFYVYGLVTGGWPTRLMIFAGVANFFLFFGADMVRMAREARARRKHKAAWEKKVK